MKKSRYVLTAINIKLSDLLSLAPLRFSTLAINEKR
jgi:hypothetical protein